MDEGSKDLRFEIIDWSNDQLAMRHCAWHQPLTDPEVKKEIQILMSSFKIKHLTSTICAACRDVMDEKLDNL